MMIRAIELVALLGAGVAGVAVSTLMSSPQTERAAAVETGAICTRMGSVANSSDWASLDPDFAAGKEAMAAGDWNTAIGSLKLAALREPRNADIQSHIGYSYRRSRQLQLALAHFRQAVAFNPRHRMAHQHLGETYLATGDLAKAEEHLLALERICLLPCDEYRDLRRAVAAYKVSATH